VRCRDTYPGIRRGDRSVVDGLPGCALPVTRSAPRLYVAPDAQALADRYAERFEILPGEPYPQDHPDFALWAVDDHLELRRAGDRRGVWMRPAELDRRAVGSTGLARACGLRPGLTERGGMRVLDAMAGWGLDGLVLASLGCSVVMVEQHPLLHALLEDFARRVDLPRVAVQSGDGYEFFSGAAGYGVVYLDPMFPVRRKRALPGKPMQFLADLGVASTRSVENWLDAALPCATGRVVIKRRLHDPVIGAPDWQIRGRVVRYDVYRGNSSGAA